MAKVLFSNKFGALRCLGAIGVGAVASTPHTSDCAKIARAVRPTFSVRKAQSCVSFRGEPMHNNVISEAGHW